MRPVFLSEKILRQDYGSSADQIKNEARLTASLSVLAGLSMVSTELSVANLVDSIAKKDNQTANPSTPGLR